MSLVLYNIYLHEIDHFINENKLLSMFCDGKRLNPNFKSTKLLRVFEQKIFQGDYVRKAKDELKMWKYDQKLRISRLKLAEKLNIRKVYYKGRNCCIVYLRFTDDFIIFVWGNKEDCFIFKRNVTIFLKLALDSFDKKN